LGVIFFKNTVRHFEQHNQEEHMNSLLKLYLTTFFLISPLTGMEIAQKVNEASKELHQAILGKKAVILDQVKKLRARGADLDQINWTGFEWRNLSLLTEALKRDSLEQNINALIDAGANVNPKNTESPLHALITNVEDEQKAIRIARRLIAKGADMNARSAVEGEEETPLYAAVNRIKARPNGFELFKYLLSQPGIILTLESRGIGGTPLGRAEAGLQNILWTRRWSPDEASRVEKYYPTIVVLIHDYQTNNPQSMTPTLPLDPVVRDPFKARETLRQELSKPGMTLARIKQLQHQGADLNEKDINGVPLLVEAIKRNFPEQSINMLIDAGAKVTTRSPLYTVARYIEDEQEAIRIARKLIAKGADVNDISYGLNERERRSYRLGTALHGAIRAAADYPRLAFIKYLLSVPGINLYLEDYQNQNALDKALSDNNEEVFNKLKFTESQKARAREYYPKIATMIAEQEQ
jgi:ankyrin repeat protein